MLKSIFLLALLVTGLGAHVAGQPASRGLDGSWTGTLEAGGARLRLALTITRSAEGTYSGKLDSLDQGSTIPIDSITVTGDRVRLELKAVNGVFDGSLNIGRTELSGNWSQGGEPLALVFRRSEAAATPTPAPTAVPQRPLSIPFEVRIPVAPTAFKGGGKTYLVYELHLTNFSRDEWTLKRVDVASGGAAIAKYEGDDLTAALARPGSAVTGAQRMTIGGGLRAVVYLWVTLANGASTPADLDHRLTFKPATWPEELILDIGKARVQQKPIAISPPLRGDAWVAANGPANTTGHRRAMIPVDGAAHIAQRFAIDWVQLWPEGGTYKGDRLDNKNYRCYGAEALAVADGTVVAVKDGIPENIPGANSRAVPITLETVGGNHVILDLGGGRFAFYAHLQPGKIPVKVGDKVKRGQTVGLVGNSGNSTEPHLHFHISDANSPLGSEGLPYIFASFEVQGKGWGWKPGPNATTEKRVNEMPLDSDVVRFPAKP